MEALRIFVSSPGDVAAEREQARRVIARLNADFGRFLQLDAYFWEEHGQSATAHFQEQVEDPAGFDLVVCLLWSRLGSLLPRDRFAKPDGSRYRSGTEYELDCALRAFGEHGRPDVWVYRNFEEPQRPVSQTAERAEAEAQWRSLEAFWNDWFRHPDGSFRAAFNEYRSAGDFAEQLDRDLRAFCLKHVPALCSDAPEPGSWTRDESPFRGLLSFGPEHAPVYFGRRAARERLLAQLELQATRGRAFVLVLGMSGCGKSSLVQAGLVPWLQTHGAGGITRDHWHWLRLQPGAAGGDLLTALATKLFEPQVVRAGLAGVGYADPAALAELLRHAAAPADHALLHRPLQAAIQDDARVLLFIDQFEELFAPGGPDAAAQAAFIAALAALAASDRVWVVATLRSDCYAPAAALPQLVELKADVGTFDLAPPGAAEIGEIVRFPALAARLEFERDPDTGEALDEWLIDAAAADPGALPLLEFTLDALYEHRNGPCLTLAACRALGGLEGALGTRAEEAVAALPEAQQAALKRLFRALVTLPDSGDGVATARTLALATLPTDSDLRRLADALVDARLLVADRDASGRPVLRLAHEALLAHWPSLLAWRSEDLDFLRRRSRLLPDAQEWLVRQRHADLLLQEGLPLQEGLALLDRDRADLDDGVIAFVEASAAAVRTRRRQRVALLAAVFVVISVTAAVSVWQWSRAESNLELAEASRRTADEQRQQAEASRRIAEEQKQQAEAQKQRAEKQKALALQAINRLTYDLPERLRRLPQSSAVIKDVFEENSALLEQIVALEGNDTEALREKASNLQRTGDMWLTLGETKKALAAFEACRSIAARLVAQNPDDRNRQRDLSVSQNKIGDVLVAQGDRPGALAAYRAGLAIREKLAAQDRGNTDWQRDLSVSHDRIGDVLVAQGDRPGALAAYRAGLAGQTHLPTL